MLYLMGSLRYRFIKILRNAAVFRKSTEKAPTMETLEEKNGERELRFLLSVCDT